MLYRALRSFEEKLIEIELMSLRREEETKQTEAKERKNAQEKSVGRYTVGVAVGQAGWAEKRAGFGQRTPRRFTSHFLHFELDSK